MERPFQAYSGDEPYLFVCYSHDDRAQVYPEIVRLKEAGCRIWYDEGIAPGSEWSDTLAQRIERCAVFLYFVTPRSAVSEHCRREVNYALEQPCGMLAVHLEPTKLPSGLRLTLSNRQAILRYEEPPAVYETKLTNAIAEAQRTDFPEATPATQFTIGDWTLDVAAHRITRDDQSHTLDPKAQSVLLHLIDRAPEVVSREGLMRRTWPDVVVGDNVIDQAISQLRRAFGDDPRNPSYIETLPKRGYRLLAPLGGNSTDVSERGLSVRGLKERSTSPVVPRATAKRRKLSQLGIAASIAVLLFAVIGYRQVFDEAPTTPPKLAVAAFDAPLGNNQLSEYATVFREEFVHHLARLGGQMIATDVDAAEYVVEGRMSDVEGRTRLFLQVIDRKGKASLWSKSIDLPSEPTQAVLKSRPEHLATIALLVAGKWSEAATMTTSRQAARAYIAGLVEYLEATQGMGGSFDVAIAHLERANELDPEFLEPLSMIANDYKNFRYGQLRYAEAVGPAHEYARRILSIDENETLTLAAINRVLDLDYAASLANLEHARQHGSPPSIVEFEIALTRLHQGRLEDAIEHLRAALRMGGWGNQAAASVLIAHAYFCMGDYEAALAAGEASLMHVAGTGPYAELPVQMLMVDALYRLDRQGEAEALFDAAWQQYGADHPSHFAATAALLGQTAHAEEILREAASRYGKGAVVDTRALFNAAFYLEDLDLAFQWLDRAIDERGGLLALLPQLHRSTLLDPLRQEPRFQAAMARIAELEAIGTPTASVAYPPPAAGQSRSQ